VFYLEQTTVAIDRKTLDKLTVIAQKSSLTKTEIITDFIESLSKLVEEARPSTEKISLTNWHIDLVKGTMEISFANLFDLTELPRFIQDFYACQKRIEDLEMSKQPISKEILLKEGFNETDIDILLKERKK
jgi:hypothetical protein